MGAHDNLYTKNLTATFLRSQPGRASRAFSSKGHPKNLTIAAPRMGRHMAVATERLVNRRVGIRHGGLPSEAGLMSYFDQVIPSALPQYSHHWYQWTPATTPSKSQLLEQPGFLL
jgi:hypothetical protein